VAVGILLPEHLLRILKDARPDDEVRRAPVRQSPTRLPHGGAGELPGNAPELAVAATTEEDNLGCILSQLTRQPFQSIIMSQGGNL
jgi:hypothetical protein